MTEEERKQKASRERKEHERYITLNRCLTMYEALRRFCSHNQAGVAPEKGFDEMWSIFDKDVENIREMMYEIRYGRKDN